MGHDCNFALPMGHWWKKVTLGWETWVATVLEYDNLFQPEQPNNQFEIWSEGTHQMNRLTTANYETKHKVKQSKEI